MPWIRSKIWADPVHVRLLYLYVRPISRTFLRVFVCSSFVVCLSVTATSPLTCGDVLLTMILAYEYCTVPLFSLQSVCSIRPTQLFSVMFMSVVVTRLHPYLYGSYLLV